MKNKTLLRTNLLVCIIIVCGFLVTSIISYQSNIGMVQKDMEMVSTLSLGALYNEISDIFSQPVSVSLTMANDNLLKEFLTEELQHSTEDAWQTRMRNYLNTYRLKYAYDSVFLVSTATNHYYHFAGLDRVLVAGHPENIWYYKFLWQSEEYDLNVDNDEATEDHITIFVNCKIKADDGTILGVVGVGLKVDSLQTLLGSYEEKYGIQAYLVDRNGVIQVSSSSTGHEGSNLFDSARFGDSKNLILKNRATQEDFWYSCDGGNGYIVTRYEPNLLWYLVVESDTTAAHAQILMQLIRNIVIILLIIGFVLVIITTVIKRYNVQISELTVSQELEYQRLLNEATGGLYDEIYELDITHNRAGGEHTQEYFKRLGLSSDATYDKALHFIAGTQVKSEYIQGYLDTFSTVAVLAAYKNGITNLLYDFMILEEGTEYRWARVSAQLFYWNSDNSVRMITYRKNIDAERKRELALLDSVQRDTMTGLYNKRTTEELITAFLQVHIDTNHPPHGLLIFDIDNFKAVNDTMGHSFGDRVINEIAAEIKTQFLEADIVGRIGGDEFAVLMKNIEHMEGLRQKLERLCSRIERKDFGAPEHLKIACSVGVALFPKDSTAYPELYEKADQALYYAKSHGKNSFAIFDEFDHSYSFHANQRDLELLMDAATDGLAQYACTEPLKLIYFNQKYANLFALSATTLSDPNFDPLKQLHPDDVAKIRASIMSHALMRTSFSSTLRVRHSDGHYFPVQLQGVFIHHLYQNRYPVFYVTYTNHGYSV